MTHYFEYRGECADCDRQLHIRVPKGFSASNPGQTQWGRCRECDEIRSVNRDCAKRSLSTDAAP